MRQIYLLIGVELKEYLREPGIIFWAILFPILLALGLGLAFSGRGVQERKIAIVCESSSCDLPNSILLSTDQQVGNEKTGYVDYHFVTVSWDEAILMLKQGKISLILEVKDNDIQYHFDPANSDAYFSYYQLYGLIKGHQPSSGSIEVLRQKGTRYIDFLVPGLLAMGMMMSCMWGISYSNVDRRNKKLLRRMVATPMKRYHYVVSQLAARIIMSAVESVLLILVTHWIFDITITGSLPALILLFFTGNIVFTGMAFLIASRTANTQIANGLINLVVMPMMILSGVYFSYHNFPDFMVSVIKLLPLTILADSIRSVFLEGASMTEVWPQILALNLLGTLLFVLGIRIYRWY